MAATTESQLRAWRGRGTPSTGMLTAQAYTAQAFIQHGGREPGLSSLAVATEPWVGRSCTMRLCLPWARPLYLERPSHVAVGDC